MTLFYQTCKLLIVFMLVGYCSVNAQINRNLDVSTHKNKPHEIGDKIDSLNGVYVYYNGKTSTVLSRNLTDDGYNLGLKYQCVEFVKRYYYEYLHHKMPNSYGNAKDFFNRNLKDHQFNRERNLTQYTNPGRSKPQENDLVVFDATPDNQYGHVAIVSKVNRDSLEIIQQNPITGSKSRETYRLSHKNEEWFIENEVILGWLRKE